MCIRSVNEHYKLGTLLNWIQLGICVGREIKAAGLECESVSMHILCAD